MVRPMSSFVFVHGHWHGGWAFDRVREILDGRGHQTLAPDLPSDQLAAGAAANARAVIDAMAEIDDSAILVGHSAGGLTIPIVASERPVAQLIFIAAVLPKPGVSLDDQFLAEPDMAPPGFSWLERDDGLLGLSEAVALEYFFHDCPAEVARAAAARMRPQTSRTLVEVTPLEVWPDTPRAAIACSRDRVIGPQWQVRAARTRLGVEPIVLDCGHSPAVACPGDLADALGQLVLG